jgi:predicted MFS family arabinose efflux permease
VARDVLHLDASGLGFLMASMGGGAVAGGLAVSVTSGRVSRPLLINVGAVLFGVALMAFELVRTPLATAMLLVALGALQTVTISTLTGSIQIAVDDGMRGRVMSMLAAMFFGLSTLGGLLLGMLGDRIGVTQAIAIGGVVSTVFALGRLVRRPRAAQTA